MAKLYTRKSDGTYVPNNPQSVTNIDVVQTTGDSVTAAMSQDAVTKKLATKQDTLTDTDGGYGQRVANLEKEGIASDEKLAELEADISKTTEIVDGANADLDFSDENGNVLVKFKDGGIQTKEFNSANTPSINNVDGGDLEISDEQGNTIALFKDGHIKTQNFDSSKIADLTSKKFIGKKIGLIADSITTFSGWLPSDISGYSGASYETYYPRGNVDSVTKTWWYKMAEMLGLNPATDISNCAWSGSRVTGDSTSTTNAAAACSNRRISDLAIRGYNPDIIICFISCNDWGNTPNVPIGTWKVTEPIPSEGTITTMREAYALMLYKIHSAYPNARVFCCTNMDDKARDRTEGWPPNNYNGVSVYEWNQNIIEIAEAFGCDIINMHNCGINYANMSNFVVDAGLHPNARGMEMMAQKVVAELIAKY